MNENKPKAVHAFIFSMNAREMIHALGRDQRQTEKPSSLEGNVAMGVPYYFL